MSQEPILGVIGGSGVYDLPGLEDRARGADRRSPGVSPRTLSRFGRIGETELVFLPRHGRGHVYSPPTSITAPISTR